MARNMFAALDGLDDEAIFAPLPAPDVVGQDSAGAGVKKARSLERARRAPMTFLYPQTAHPPIIAPVHVMNSEIPYPPRRIRTIRDAKKMAALRLGATYGSSVIIYGWYAAGPLQY